MAASNMHLESLEGIMWNVIEIQEMIEGCKPFNMTPNAVIGFADELDQKTHEIKDMVDLIKRIAINALKDR